MSNRNLRHEDGPRTIPLTNPFSTRFISAANASWIPRADCQPDPLAEQFAEFQFRAQIIGPHGSGKTTLLFQLVPILERNHNVHFVQLQSHQNRLEEARVLLEPENVDPSKDDLTIVDGFEALSWLERRKLLEPERYSRLLITTHRDSGLPTLVATEMRPELLLEIVDSLTSKNDFEFDVEAARALLKKHQGNGREALFELYDRFEQQEKAKRSKSS